MIKSTSNSKLLRARVCPKDNNEMHKVREGFAVMIASTNNNDARIQMSDVEVVIEENP